MELSIIIPVYNVENHLIRCLDSITAQMLPNYEIILIDDGSTDNSGTLCDKFIKENHHLKVKVIHQVNKGLSIARNEGIKIAQGKYITFIDSDDEICANTLNENVEFLLNHPDVDMLEYPIEVHAESPKAYHLTFPNETQHTDIFADWIRREGYTHCYACNKIYKAELWQEIHFPIGAYFEDRAVMPTIVRKCKSIHYSNRGCYRYILHPGTITTSYSYIKLRQLFINNHQLYLEIKDTLSLRIESIHLWTYCLNQLIDMGRCKDADHTEISQFIKEMDIYRPSYNDLLHTIYISPNKTRLLKLLPLPLIGLPNYYRCYTTLATTL